MGSGAESQPAIRGWLRVRSLADTWRVEEQLTYLQTDGGLQLHYEQTYFSRSRLWGWGLGRWVLCLSGALCHRFQSYRLQRDVPDSGGSTSRLLMRCAKDAGLFILCSVPWVCCLWCLACLFASGSQPCPLCPHCLWCLPCLWLLPCLYYLWCLCIRKADTLYVLYHSSTLDMFKLTDAPDSLYHLYLQYMTLKVGRPNLIAIIDGVDDAQAVEESIKWEQPTLGQCCAGIFVFQDLKRDWEADPNAGEARRLKDYVAEYFSRPQQAGD
ncbi:uncharacterized protein LOC119976413 [Scyliorhinus canicula]|uniref:uncharacterized protein LOC119976413 n=1 Tax=Scyliorhinus canicula TaxID=7830 RepID=UPI0018F5ECF0|nr:uncharacterized protein LOC119976413 [Scyliorhinus canicula]